jgi:hypothetical protein
MKGIEPSAARCESVLGMMIDNSTSLYGPTLAQYSILSVKEARQQQVHINLIVPIPPSPFAGRTPKTDLQLEDP